MTKLGERCLKSWKKYCPDYEIIRWDENNFDINSNLYCKQAYEAKKYAFVSDYIRLWAMVNHGGIYMDTDVEVIKPLDGFLEHKAFSGFENSTQIPTGIMACEKNFPLFSELLSDYANRSFIMENGEFNRTTNVKYITDKSLGKGLVANNSLQDIENFVLYPNDYFCPIDTQTSKLRLTVNTHTIHHFEASWYTPKQKFMRTCKKIFVAIFGVKRYNKIRGNK